MIEVALRPFWIRGINDVTGKLNFNFIDFIENGRGYVVYDDIEKTKFSLTITDYDALLRGFAFDINRFGCASIESVNSIYHNPDFPQSHAWNCIKCYYAAFYAAHATLRMLGISCTNFERTSLGVIENIADLDGKQKSINITKGYYKCSIEPYNVECSSMNVTTSKGSHEQLWHVYLNKIDNIIGVLKHEYPSIEIQAALLKLTDLKENLTYHGCNSGNWLSKIRNEISYKQANGLWYPYKEAEKCFKHIQKTISYWGLEPELIDISLYDGEPILRYLSTCTFIVSVYVAVAREMNLRCSRGKSFHQNGILSFINKINT